MMADIYHGKNLDNTDADPCLTDMQMAALIDGNLKSREKQTCMQHINRCSDCRYCWMEASAYIDSYAPVPDSYPWYKQMGKLIAEISMPRKFVSGIAFAVTAVLCVFVLLPFNNNIAPVLDEQYSLLTAQNSQQADKIMSQMSMPWEHAALGFIPTRTNASELAFGAGLWDGRNALSDAIDRPRPAALSPKQSDHWSAGKQKDFYQLGRWITALWLAAQLETEFDWNKQADILGSFYNKLQAQGTADPQTIKAIENLQQINLALTQVKEQNFAKHQLKRQLQIIMLRLGPAALDER